MRNICIQAILSFKPMYVIMKEYNRTIILVITILAVTSVLLIISQKSQLNAAHGTIEELKIQMLESGAQIDQAVAELNFIRSQHLFEDQTAELAKVALKLEDSSLLLKGLENNTFGMTNSASLNDTHTNQSEVCPEIYIGNRLVGDRNTVFYHYSSWQLENCTHVNTSFDKLITIHFSAEDAESIERVTNSLWRFYPGVQVIVEGNLNDSFSGNKFMTGFHHP